VPAKPRSKPKSKPVLPAARALRDAYGLTQPTLARLCDVSVRTLAAWETRADLRPLPRPRPLVAARRLLDGLADIMRKEHVRVWLEEPNPAFGGLKPLEVVERGEVDRLFETIYRVGSGEPI
jgi:transcriptional regulator with XRE-family HTH domain